MNTTWRFEVPQLFIVAGMLLAAATIWPNAPESFPVHWNIRGEVDRYGGKFEGLLAIPLTAVGLYLLLLAIPKIDPGRANYRSFRSAYAIIRLSILSFLALLYACMQFVAFGYSIDMGAVVFGAVGVLFVILGNVMGKIRPNWFVGVRTPWTLSSRRSWNKTHRLAGWLFVVMGVSFGLCGFVRALWMLFAAISVMIVSLATIFIYSYLVWRDDPERLSPTAISPSPDDA